jgi:hypothetical protein
MSTVLCTGGTDGGSNNSSKAASCVKSVAVCFYGITRSLKKYTYVSIQRNLLWPILKQVRDLIMAGVNDAGFLLSMPPAKVCLVFKEQKERRGLHSTQRN